MKKPMIIFCTVLLSTLQSCGIYSFTGANVGEAETFQVNFFQNNADLVEPGIDRAFTQSLQELIQNQTRLSLVNNNGDLIFEGEIVEYYISPMSATAQSTAAQNRLTIGINVRYYNTLVPEQDFERRFSFFYDYPANVQLVGANLQTALDEIYNRITQDVFNAALSNW
ncbi:MAG: LptE family protein [Christiangramia sp.]|uniref:LptE family protein n=1 Tax=Christiangramia sp. TaxID=1931228 RepID=UPI0032428D60